MRSSMKRRLRLLSMILEHSKRSCCCGLWCAGAKQAKNMLRFSINVAHDLHLLATLEKIALIDTDGVPPWYTCAI